MKQIVYFIQEGLRINKNIKITNKKIEIKFDKEKIDFPENDVDEIIEYAEHLPKVPDAIEYFYNSDSIRLRYNVKNNQIKLRYGIIFSHFRSKEPGYRVAFLDDTEYIYEYPEFPKVMSLNDCFEYINKKFDDVIK